MDEIAGPTNQGIAAYFPAAVSSKVGLFEAWNLSGPNVESYGPRLAGRTRDEAEASQRNDHLVNRGRRDFEVAL